jgi:hypothetical protein
MATEVVSSVTSQPYAYHTQEDAVSNPKDQFRIQLTPEQKAQVRTATGKEAEAVELSVEELEERIAPASFNLGKGA